MNPLDLALQRSFPTVMVPRKEPMAPMAAPGERLLVAADGVYLEIVRPWLRLVRRIAGYDVKTAIPYGTVAEDTNLLCGAVPPALVAQCLAIARETLPNEAGAWIVWNSHTRVFRVVRLASLSHGPGHLLYERPALEDGECLVVDCHSHGLGEAFFSCTDNDDDRHDVKFALVLGNCDRAVPSTALRLCAKGIFEKSASLPQAWERALAGAVLSC